MGRIRALVVIAGMFGGVLPAEPLSAECITVVRTAAEWLEVTPIVFVADVIGIENAQPGRIRVRFRVLEGYRGIETGERVLLFRLSAEGYAFHVGQRVLVYAEGTRDNYSTQCTRTRAVTLQDPEVQELRRLLRN